ncbi:DET1 homolog [Oppia nitens]|uniref:DET1 homolog n=1 Tax=Oppia nitens TaxID=1686743 RepID=UPI0023DC0B8F|nr:DET1 homolog [Oppia nitens]
MCKKCESCDGHQNSLIDGCRRNEVSTVSVVPRKLVATKRPIDASANDDQEFNDWEGIKRRRICPQNLVIRLLRREVSYGRPVGGCGIGRHGLRSLHQNIVPNFTIVNIEKPNCFLRKFTPDGRHLLAFSADQTCIEIYQYMGPSAASHLLKDIPSAQEFTTNGSDEKSQRLKSKVFETLFKLKNVVNVTTNGEQLNRECSLFTDDSRFVIVCSAALVGEESPPVYFDIYRNNESVSPSQRSPLEDYSLHLIDIINGRVCDKRVFKTDKIILSHNQGIYLYRNTLAVLSVQHQTIHVFQISKEGQFIDAKSIGRFCYEDDEFLVSSAATRERSASTGSRHHHHQSNIIRPFREVTLNSLKHRLMVFLYRKAHLESQLNGNNLPLRRFYQNFDQFCALRIWKMQLLDENHLLLKYASEEVITLRLSDLNSPPSLFVVYNINTSCVISVFENTSEELLQLFESFCDLFRNCSLQSSQQLICSPSNNIHSRLLQQRFKQTIVNARNGGQTEAVRRLLAQLPISAQSFTCSPYLDLSLFSYDDKWITLMERPRSCGDHPIRFYARDSGILRFKIFTGLQNHRTTVSTARRLVAFTLHPTDPLLISVQRINAEYVVNLHVRHFNP